MKIKADKKINVEVKNSEAELVVAKSKAVNSVLSSVAIKSNEISVF